MYMGKKNKETFIIITIIFTFHAQLQLRQRLRQLTSSVMKKAPIIALGTGSRVKEDAVRRAWPSSQVLTMPAFRSEVPEQPVGRPETHLGAQCRAYAARHANPGVDIAIGIEACVFVKASNTVQSGMVLVPVGVEFSSDVILDDSDTNIVHNVKATKWVDAACIVLLVKDDPVEHVVWSEAFGIIALPAILTVQC